MNVFLTSYAKRLVKEFYFTFIKKARETLLKAEYIVLYKI